MVGGWCSAVDADHEHILSLLARDPIGWIDGRTYRQYLISRSYGSDRIWIAEDRGRIVAYAIWYGSVPDEHALILDGLWVEPEVHDRENVASALITAAHATFRARGASPPEYHLFLKPEGDTKRR